ncbi:MAG: A/G-specific adenine glycosylase [Sterolibacterium sp.]|nr:A/G-specific adenine glycosylase [Sterolibacterium sp.]
MNTDSFAERLIHWQRQHGRHGLPWQNTQDAYRIWLSEIMLQQTQVVTVIPYYQRFLTRFPDLAALAAATQEEVMPWWSGLGYYARARNLHRCAQQIMAQYAGQFPADPALLAQLPGIGQSTANAIAVFAFGQRLPILDGNVKRVLCRVCAIEDFPGTASVERQLWQLAATLLPSQIAEAAAGDEPVTAIVTAVKTDCARYIQAQMDLGATVCTRHQPACGVCPLQAICIAHRDGRTAELPRSRPRKTLPQRSVQVLLLHDGQRWLLEQRPGRGIWGGLLSLPELTEGESLQQRLDALACTATADEQALPPLRHGFTHFQLTLRPLLVAVQPVQKVAEAGHQHWLTPAELDHAALPAPIRKLLHAAGLRLAV